MATIVVCPNCGFHFNRPFMTEKRSGLGFTFGPLGAIKCPHCGYKAGWGAFKNEKDVPQASANQFPAGEKETTAQSQAEEDPSKKLDETKYES